MENAVKRQNDTLGHADKCGINKNNIEIMGNYIKYSGFALIIIGAILLITSYFVGWNNINAVNVGAFAAMVVGLVTYIIGGKRSLEE